MRSHRVQWEEVTWRCERAVLSTSPACDSRAMERLDVQRDGFHVPPTGNVEAALTVTAPTLSEHPQHDSASLHNNLSRMMMEMLMNCWPVSFLMSLALCCH